MTFNEKTAIDSLFWAIRYICITPGNANLHLKIATLHDSLELGMSQADEDLVLPGTLRDVALKKVKVGEEQ